MQTKRAQKNIKATNAKNHKAAGGKDLIIPVGKFGPSLRSSRGT